MRGWHKIAAGAAALLLLAAYAIGWRAPAVGTFHDDGVYLVTAKALAEGKGYRIISLPEAIPQTKYPVLFPLVLAALWKLDPEFPGNLWWLKLAPLFAAAAWLWVSYRLLRQEGVGVAPATGIVLLAAASPWVVYLSTALLAETLFAFLATAAVMLVRRIEQGSAGRWCWLAAAVLAAGAFHTRTAGIAIVIAAPVVLWLKQYRRESVGFAVCAVILCAPWVLWSAAQQLPQTDPYYTKANYLGWNIVLNFTWPQKAFILFQNSVIVLLSPMKLAGLPATGPLALPAGIAGALALIGLLRTGRTAITGFVLCYLALVCCWAWHPGRLLVPLLPLLLWGGWRILERLPARSRIAAATITAATVLGSLGAASIRTHRLGDPLPALDDGDSWAGQVQLFQWTKQHTPKEAILAGNLDPLYFLMTGRKAVRGFTADPYGLLYRQAPDPIGTKEQVLQGLENLGARYWLGSPNSAFAEGPLLRKMQAELAELGRMLLKQLPQDEAGTFHLYEIREHSAHAFGTRKEPQLR